jgi:hypothetical protein
VSQAAYGLGSAKRRERNHLSRVYGLGRNPAQLFRRASKERVMAASDATVREMAKALRRHVDQQTLEKVINDLLDVPGDKSFRDAVEQLAHDLTARSGR